MPLKDLVVYLGNRKASGNISLESEGIRKTVMVREGTVILASSNRPREYLGQFLINMGQLSEDQFATAYQKQQQSKILLGQVLVQSGMVSEAAVLNSLSLKFRETMLSAFAWTEGTFSFTPEPPETLQGLEVQVELLDIAREGEFRETAWQAIRAVFPSGRVRLALRRENLAETPGTGTLDEKLFELVEEGLTVDELVLALHATDFFLYQRLYALYRLDAIAVLEEAPEVPTLAGVPDLPRVVGQESSADEIFRHAQAFLELGNLYDAAVLARRAYEMGATPETTAFLRRAEAALTAQLKTELTDAEHVPTLLVPTPKLKTMTLSAPERYLLSRIDGTRTVRAIIQVSPIHELDALRFFKSFIEGNLVSLQDSDFI